MWGENRSPSESPPGVIAIASPAVFAALLRQLGYDVTLLSARVISDDGHMGQEFDHMTLRVDIDRACEEKLDVVAERVAKRERDATAAAT